MTRVRALLGRLRWIHLAPVLGFVALAAWAFASPIGASPDDDYHLTSIWCAAGGSPQCVEGSTPISREVAAPLQQIDCYAPIAEKSAACQAESLAGWTTEVVDTDRGNFRGEYPAVYYTVMRALAGSDLQVSALAMRLVTAALFVAVATALAVLLPVARRSMLLWGWLVTLVPLGMFIIPSNNPSGWAIVGVGTAFLALTGWHESSGRRRVALAAIVLIGVLMAAGSRGDGAVYAVGAILTATIVTGPWRGTPVRTWWRWAWLPAAGTLLALVFFATAGQSGIAQSGFGGGEASLPDGTGEATPSGFALAAYNLLMLPSLWSGVWGTTALGSMDTVLPTIVPAAAGSAFIVVAFAGVARLDLRKAIAAAGVLLVLVALPVWVLTRGGNVVGENLQARYLLPLVVLFVFVLLWLPAGAQLVFTRVQTAAILGALAIANLVALQVDIRRYVTGSDQQGFNLDAGAEWWWVGLPVGPTAMWMIGALSFAGLLVLLWPQLRWARQLAESELSRPRS